MKRKKRKLIRLISLLVSVSLLCSSSLMFVNAASGTTYESESNNTYASADVTYDDRNNYGALTSYADIDIWKITFTSEGFANFYLGNIPSDCNYNMIVSDYSGTMVWAFDAQSGTSHELVRLHVKANTTYYIKIYAPTMDYSSSYYLMRVKWSSLQEANYFGYTSNANNGNNGIDTLVNADYTMEHLVNMGFPDYPPMENQNASSALSFMPNSQVFVINNHGEPGLMELPTLTSYSRLFAASNSSMSSSDKALSTLAATDLSNTSIVIFGGCSSGNNDANGNNLVDSAVSKGAICSISWKNSIYTADINLWLESFFYFCSLGYTLYDACEAADDEGGYESLVQIANRYYGSARATANAMSTVIAVCE